MQLRLTQISASVHAKYKGKLDELDHLEKIMHTVTLSDDSGTQQTRDVMATDPLDAIDQVKREFVQATPASTETCTSTSGYPYNIDAHQRKVEDLPEDFLLKLREVMHDKSYGNDTCATFGMLHPDKDKMYHLAIEHLIPEEREYPEEKRFYFNLVSLFDDETYSVDDHSYLACSNLDEVNCIIHTDSIDELSAALAKVFPQFNDL